MSVLLVQAQARRREDPTYPVPRWLRHGGRGPTPVGTDPWDQARAADATRGTWTVVVGEGRSRRVIRRDHTGYPAPPDSELTREEWGVLIHESLAAWAEAHALAGDTAPLPEIVARMAGWAATDRAVGAAQVAALLAGLAARGALADDEADSDDSGDPAQPRGPPGGRDRELVSAPVRRLVATPRRESVPWPPAPWSSRGLPVP